jgi:hypothetical protein
VIAMRPSLLLGLKIVTRLTFLENCKKLLEHCFVKFAEVQMATADERKLELERKKQRLAEIREEKKKREDEKRRKLLPVGASGTHCLF